MALEKTHYWKHIIAKIKADHICENYVEKQKLYEMGIEARVQPIFLSSVPKLSYQHSENIHVYMTVREGSEKEYGLDTIEKISTNCPGILFHVFGVHGKTELIEGYSKGLVAFPGAVEQFKWKAETHLSGISRNNIIYHGNMPEEVFNDKIKDYHACIRLNEHDGFGDALAKSALMGQWPISVIAYPYITHAPGTKALISALKDLKNKKVPNYEGASYWKEELSRDLV